MTTVREHLDALGFTSDDHDANVREALLELRHARLSLRELRAQHIPGEDMPGNVVTRILSDAQDVL